MPKFHYKILGLNENATHEQVKQKYKELSLMWHPDKNLDDTQNATKMFNLISEAFQVLGHRERRKEYDSKSTQPSKYKLYGGMDLFSKMFPNQRNVRSDLNRFHNQPPSIFNNNGGLFGNLASIFQDPFMNSSISSRNMSNSPAMVFSSSSSSSFDKNGKRNSQSTSVKQYIKNGIKYTEESITTPDGKTKTNKYQEKINSQQSPQPPQPQRQSQRQPQSQSHRRITQPPQTPLRR